MYRFYSALAVLLGTIIISGVGFYYNTHAANEISSSLENAYEYAQNGDIVLSNKSIQKAEITLKNNRKQLYLFVSHEKIDDIERNIEKASVCLNNNNLPLFMIYCRTAINLTEDFKNLEYPYLYNII